MAKPKVASNVWGWRFCCQFSAMSFCGNPSTKSSICYSISLVTWMDWTHSARLIWSRLPRKNVIKSHWWSHIKVTNSVLVSTKLFQSSLKRHICHTNSPQARMFQAHNHGNWQRSSLYLHCMEMLLPTAVDFGQGLYYRPSGFHHIMSQCLYRWVLEAAYASATMDIA